METLFKTKTHHFHPWKNGCFFGYQEKNNKLHRKVNIHWHHDSRPYKYRDVTRKVGGKVVLRSDMDAACEPFNRRFFFTRCVCVCVRSFFQKANFLEGRIVFWRKLIKTQKFTPLKTNCAVLGIKGINMYIYMYKCPKGFSSLEFHWKAFKNSHEPTGGRGPWKMPMVRHGQIGKATGWWFNWKCGMAMSRCFFCVWNIQIHSNIYIIYITYILDIIYVHIYPTSDLPLLT